MSSGRLLALPALLALAATAPAGARTVTVSPAPERAAPSFGVTYAGSGSWATTYHATPPNDGGAADTNDAHDTSDQRWALRFAQPLTLPRCAGCAATVTLGRARGTTSARGAIDHTHVDGLFRYDDASEACSVAARTTAGQRLHATLVARVEPGRRRLVLEALSPVDDVLLGLPPSCPGHTDSLDGLDDNYYTPGLSFAQGYGPERWFTSATVTIPLGAARRAERIRIRLADTPKGTPPRGCAVLHPDYERCSTGGSWRGVLTLSRRRRAAGR